MARAGYVFVSPGVRGAARFGSICLSLARDSVEEGLETSFKSDCVTRCCHNPEKLRVLGAFVQPTGAPTTCSPKHLVQPTGTPTMCSPKHLVQLRRFSVHLLCVHLST